MKITQDVRDYAASLKEGVDPAKGMEEKSIEFRKRGSAIYQ
jgi:phosphomethylpyrimidine synthase